MPIEKKMNPDLAKERKQCLVSTEEFAEWWHGGKARLAEKRWRDKYMLDDPEMQDKVPLHYLSHKELYEESVRKTVVAIRKIQALKHDDKHKVESITEEGLTEYWMRSYGSPFATHLMFVPTISGQGTAEQNAKWFGKASNYKLIGTYAQTELGHGTFLRGLETTATYDAQREEFVLNSPTLSSLKWWPGGLGHTANYCVVIAQLYTKGQCHGVYPFMVQLRDPDTHHPLPGIKIGEVGPKVGMNAVNQGFLGFDQVRIPRTNMLMRNAEVLADGTFVKRQLSVLTYGVMVLIRVVLVRDMSTYLAKVATIAIRYSAVRRQSQINPKEPEVQVIDHLTQQYKLFPQLAKSIVFKMAADYLWDLYDQVTSEMDQGNVDRLPELHALSCCLKAITTNDGAAGVEVCRLACGGHGYMASSNLHQIFGMVTACVTYEGENTVLLLQTARYLIKAWKWATEAQQLTPTVAYLERAVREKGAAPWNSSIVGIIESLEFAAARKVQLAYENLERRKARGLSQEQAANDTSIELVSAAESHGRAFLVRAGYDKITQEAGQVSPRLAAVLRDLLELYVVDAALKSLNDLLRFVAVSESDVNELQGRLEAVLSRLRPNAVAIVDGFDIPDQILNSTLGAYDGNVYERLFEDAMKSPLNQEPVNRTFDLYLKPMMRGKL